MMAMVPESSVLGESTHDQISPDDVILRKPELEQRDSREYRKFRRHFRRHFCIPYEFLELVQLHGKAPKVAFIGCEGRGREAVSTCSAEGQSKWLLILPKMRCVWFGFEMTLSTHRRPHCTTYSRLYYILIPYTILACADSPVQHV